MRRAISMWGAVAGLAVAGALGIGMNTGCAFVFHPFMYAPESTDYFTTRETVAAARAIRRGDVRGLERMIAGGLDVNARGRGGADLLKWSVVHFCLECLETLLERGADIDRPQVGGYTGEIEQLLLRPVMGLAAESKDPGYLALLLRHGGDPNALDVYGNRTILHEAALHSPVENVRLLVEAGADIHARENLSLETPLHRALTVRFSNAYYLLEQGADPTLEDSVGLSAIDTIQMMAVPIWDPEQHHWYVNVLERLGLDLEAVKLSHARAEAERDAADRAAAVRGFRLWPAPAEAGAVDEPATTYQTVNVFRDGLRSGGEGPEMVVIPAGRFRMGCVSGLECQDDEKPVREVTIPAPFALSVREVTFEDYDRFTHPEKVNDQGWGRGDRPVINVSWDDTKAYVAWLSSETGAEYRLPSEAEWEYAARAGSETKYSWGNEVVLNRANCLYLGFCDNRWEWTAPAGSFRANAWGLHDMHGNVREWVEDCWNPNYSGAPSDGSAWLSGNCTGRVLRGGSLFDIPQRVRAAHRQWNSTGLRVRSWGFRVARTWTPASREAGGEKQVAQKGNNGLDIQH